MESFGGGRCCCIGGERKNSGPGLSVRAGRWLAVLGLVEGVRRACGLVLLVDGLVGFSVSGHGGEPCGDKTPKQSLQPAPERPAHAQHRVCVASLLLFKQFPARPRAVERAHNKAKKKNQAGTLKFKGFD